jgi:hypothetical protein
MAQLCADGYPTATAHDPIVEIFPDVYLLRGSYRTNGIIQFNRNMVILRHQGELALLNAVRLSPEGEVQLDALGQVKHLLRLGYLHGMDDLYYVERYAAEFWAPVAPRVEFGPVPDHTPTDISALPFPGMQVFAFKQSRHSEIAILWQHQGGVLLMCDALQFYADRKYCSLFAKVMMPLMGFPLRLIIGPSWLKAMTPKGGNLCGDYTRLQTLDFKHLVAAYDSVLNDTAKEVVAEAIQAALPG